MLKRRAGDRRNPARGKRSKLNQNDGKSIETTAPQISAIILVAIDPGTDFTKASLKIINRKPSSDDPLSLSNGLANQTHAITWDHGLEYVKTQITFTKDADSDKFQFRWGNEVDEALHAGYIQVKDIIRCLKPAVFGKDIARNETSRQKISQLSAGMREVSLSQRLEHCGQSAAKSEVTDIDFFVMFLRNAWRFILNLIAEDQIHLGIPIVYDHLERYDDWEIPDYLDFRVAIPLPAGSTPTQVAQIVAAGQAAGIPSIYPVAEPISTLAYQLRMESEDLTLGKIILVIDIGAGSADVQAWQVLSIYPIRVKQIGTSKTDWVGGRTMNKKCMDLIVNMIPHLRPDVSISDGNTYSPAWEKLMYDIEENLDQRKRPFNGKSKIVLSSRDLPENITSKMINPAGNIDIDPDILKTVWKPTVDAVVAAIREARETINLDQIVMCGGTSLSRYLRTAIREQESSVPIRFPVDQSHGSRTVALGALFLLEDKEFVSSRTVLHGFCVAWWKVIDDLPGRQFPRDCIEENKVDGLFRVNVSKFFFQAGASLPTRYTAPAICGFRQLPCSSIVPTTNGSAWNIEEKLYYCAQPSADDLAVEDPANQIKEMPIPLQYEIPYQLATELWQVKEDGDEDYYETQYEVVLILDGEVMKFQIVFPKSGEFGRYRDAEEEVRLDVDFNIAGMMDLVTRE